MIPKGFIKRALSFNIAVLLLSVFFILTFYTFAHPGQAMLNFDAQTGAYTPGNPIAGATSAATATIKSVHDDGTTGILALKDVVGTFVDDEIIYESALGSEIITGTDSDFSGAGNWAAGGAATVTVDYDSGDGGHATTMRIEAGDGSFEGSNLTLTGKFVVDSFYQLQFDWKYVDSASIVTSKIRFDGGGDVYFDLAPSAIWGTQINCFKALAVSASLRIYCNFDSGNASNELLIDTLTLKKITNAALANGAVYYVRGASAW